MLVVGSDVYAQHYRLQDQDVRPYLLSSSPDSTNKSQCSEEVEVAHFLEYTQIKVNPLPCTGDAD